MSPLAASGRPEVKQFAPMGKRSTKRNHSVSPGWKQQGVILPEEWSNEFRRLITRFGTGSGKTLATAMFGAYLALPDDLRADLYADVHRLLWDRDPASVDPSEVLAVVIKRIAPLIEAELVRQGAMPADAGRDEDYAVRVLLPELLGRKNDGHERTAG